MLWTKVILAGLFATAASAACVCSKSYPFVANQNNDAGSVTVTCKTPGNSCNFDITYDTQDSGYCLDVTNLHVGQAGDVQEEDGTPKIGDFDPGDVTQDDTCTTSYTYEDVNVQCNQDKDIAAHALVYQLGAPYDVPEDASAIAGTGDGTRPFVLDIDNGETHSHVHAWFMNLHQDEDLTLPADLQQDMDVTLHSSSDPDVQQQIGLPYPELMQVTNWILNNVKFGDSMQFENGTSVTLTAGDIQWALWKLMNMEEFDPQDEGIFNQVLELAWDMGIGYTPTCTEIAGLVIAPHGGQEMVMAEMQRSNFDPNCCEEAAGYRLDDHVMVTAGPTTESSFDLEIDNGEASGHFSSWFVEVPPDRSVPPDMPVGTMEATLHSILDPAVQGQFGVLHWMLANAANWIINHVNAGETIEYANGTSGTPTAVDIQWAMWNLIHMGDFDPAEGPWNQIVELALSSGLYYVPHCDDEVALFVVPDDPQEDAMLAGVKMREFELSCCKGPTTDAWALGGASILFGNEDGWAAYNEFKCASCCGDRRERHLRAA